MKTLRMRSADHGNPGWNHRVGNHRVENHRVENPGYNDTKSAFADSPANGCAAAGKIARVPSG
jgi:hypothetical protein